MVLPETREGLGFLDGGLPDLLDELSLEEESSAEAPSKGGVGLCRERDR